MGIGDTLRQADSKIVVTWGVGIMSKDAHATCKTAYPGYFTAFNWWAFNLNPALETERVVGHSLDRIDLMDEMDRRSVVRSIGSIRSIQSIAWAGKAALTAEFRFKPYAKGFA